MEYFKVSNPNNLEDGSVSYIAIPFRNINKENNELFIERGSGPVKGMCYVLFERDHQIPPEEAVKEPTEAAPKDHKGWNKIGKGVFQGWAEEEKNDESVFISNLVDKTNQKNIIPHWINKRNIWNPILIDEKTKKPILQEKKDKLRFVRNYRPVYDNFNERVLSYSASNDITNNLYWKQCIHNITLGQLEEGTSKIKTLAKILTTKEASSIDEKIPNAFISDGLIGAYMGGYKRKKRRRKTKKRKSRRKKRKRTRKRKKKRTRRTKRKSRSIRN